MATALGSGIYLCVFSTIVAFMLISVDYYCRKVPQIQNEERQVIDNRFHLSALKTFEKGYWINTADAFIQYSITFTSIVIGPDLLMKKYGHSLSSASFIVTLPYSITFVLAPILGWVANKYG